MATNLKVKILEKDNIQALEKAINDFFTAIGNKQVNQVEINGNPLHQGNKIYVGTIFYDSVTASAEAPLVKLFEEDGSAQLGNIMNAYISPGAAPSSVQVSEIILKNGNNSYIGLVAYNITSSSSNSMVKIHRTIFTRAQILSFGSGILVNQLPVLPKAAAGSINMVRSITEKLTIGTGGVPFAGSGQLNYFIKNNEVNINFGFGIFCDNSDCITQSADRTTIANYQNQRAFSAGYTMQQTSGIAIPDDLMIGTEIGSFALSGGNANSTLTVDVEYEAVKLDT